MANEAPKNCNNNPVTSAETALSTQITEQPKRFQVWLGFDILAGLYLLVYSTFGIVLISRENNAFYTEFFKDILWIAVGATAMYIISGIGELIGKKYPLLANIVFLVFIHIPLLAGLGIMLIVLNTQPQYSYNYNP
jgi:uncharacterized membrane protein YkvI